MEPEIRVSTVVQPHEDPEKVILAVRNIFPDWSPNKNMVRRTFPHHGSADVLHGNTQSLDKFLESISEQRILDTALDAMTLDMEGGRHTDFSISRQAALVGKVSFSLGERTTGGAIEISIRGEDIDHWIEDITWHQGRSAIPRRAGDELSMSEDGTPNEWFDKRGRPMIGEED